MRYATDLRRSLRSSLGEFVSRLLGYAGQYQERQRLRDLARLCRFDRSATIGASAGFANVRGDPDHIVIGAASAVLGELIVFPESGKITIGRKSFVGPGARLWSAASITIGDYVLISHGVNIHDNISHPMSWRERRLDIDRLLPGLTLHAHDFDLRARPVVIEDDVWIGFGASIVGGVRVGRGAVIGAGTMVTGDVEPFTVVVGNPMRVVRSLDEEQAPSDAG